MLGSPSHVEGGEADPIVLPSALCAKELLAAIEPTQGVFAAIKRRKG
jgi:hypothetical protein